MSDVGLFRRIWPYLRPDRGMFALALALTLSDQIAEMAAGGAAPLDSMFLDEGFGTLDDSALDHADTVAIEIIGHEARDGA